MWGLVNEGLIDSTFYFGGEKKLIKYYKDAKDGLLIKPSAKGIELFLWVHGRGDCNVVDYLKKDYQFESFQQDFYQ